MDYDEEEERYKQVKSVSGGGTRLKIKIKQWKISKLWLKIFFSQMAIQKNPPKILRLYLCTTKKTGHQPSGVEGVYAISQPSVVDLTDNEQNQAVEDLLVENRNSESPNHSGNNNGASSGYLELNDTLPWDGLLTLAESEDSDAWVMTTWK